MSDWRDVLKMPPRIDTAQNRDADYTQQITEFDEKVISPKFEEYIRSQPMNEKITGYIKTYDNDSDVFRGGTYFIGKDTRQKLGSNTEAIMQVLQKTYTEAGYKAQISGPVGKEYLQFFKE